MQSVIPWFFWLFPIAFTIHNIEEALWLPAFSKSAGKFHKPVNSFEFAFALIILTLLSIIITFLFFQNENKVYTVIYILHLILGCCLMYFILT